VKEHGIVETLVFREKEKILEEFSLDHVVNCFIGSGFARVHAAYHRLKDLDFILRSKTFYQILVYWG